MIDDPFYLIGRRDGVKPVANDLSVTSLPVASLAGSNGLRAEDSLAGSNSKALRAFGWSAATFGAGAILGWLDRTRGGK